MYQFQNVFRQNSVGIFRNKRFRTALKFTVGFSRNSAERKFKRQRGFGAVMCCVLVLNLAFLLKEVE